MLQKSEKLVILHTNDIHSHFERMPYIAKLLNQERQKAGQTATLTVDCGDHIDRAYIETEGSMGIANVEVMNACSYDLVLPGNNEGLTLSPSFLAEAYRHARFGIICANLFEADSGTPPEWMNPSRILVRGNLRIGVVGVTVAYIEFYRLLGWKVMDPIDAVRQQVGRIRDKVDLLIVLSHLGLPNDRLLASTVDGIDLILGGHTHHLLEQPLLESSTLICGAGKFGTHIGRVEISYDLELQQIIELKGTCIPTVDIEPDQGIASLVEQFHEQSRLKLSRPISQLAQPLGIHWESESPLGNLLAEGIRRHTGADIGLVNAGQILEGLEQGTVSLERLHQICPSPINSCLYWLKGQDLLEALESALLLEYTSKPIYGYGFRGKILGILCLNGMEIEYHPEGPPNQKISRVMVGGELFNPEQEYLVGTIDMFVFGLGYPSLSRGRNVQFFSPYFLRELLADELIRLQDRSQEELIRHWVPTNTAYK
ncbi:MAG: bifunctional metallophosphatase/5'-nucleotidase [Gorillibacterium sp.]|nr:bifunctional metallophosphatase/5'-nucleotidase [Gorillibacterium sp.]